MIRIIQPGTFTTVQDLRRVGFQSSGVPECGAVDKFSMRCANLLVGNDDSDPVLEMTIFGPQITFEDSAVVAVTCLLYTSPSPRDGLLSRMPSSA